MRCSFLPLNLLIAATLVMQAGSARAASTLPADLALVANYPDENIAQIANAPPEEGAPYSDGEAARREICTRLAGKANRDAATLEKFLTAWHEQMPRPTPYKMRSALKLADLLLKNSRETKDETARLAQEQRAVFWLEKILEVSAEEVGRQSITDDLRKRANGLGARESLNPPPAEYIAERAKRTLARATEDATKEAASLRRSAANRLTHLAAMEAQEAGDFSRFDGLIKTASPDVQEIYVASFLKSRILRGSPKGAVPIPNVTPFEKDPFGRSRYISGFSLGYRSVLASAEITSPLPLEDPLNKAELSGWEDGLAQARKDHPEKAAHLPKSE